jgi:hypothetical protein
LLVEQDYLLVIMLELVQNPMIGILDLVHNLIT